MEVRYIGALLIIGGCGGVGFGMAGEYHRRIRMLRQLRLMLVWMQGELRYRMTALPELIAGGAKRCSGGNRQVLDKFCRELEQRRAPDPGSCMQAALNNSDLQDRTLRRIFGRLGQSLGNFDLEGQIEGIRETMGQIQRELDALEADRSNRVRSYRTLSICAGVGLAILLI